MKHIHALLMTVLLSMSASAATTDAPPPSEPRARQTILGISVLPLLGNDLLEVSGERVVGPRLSVGLALQAGITRQEYRSEVLGNPGIDGASDQREYLLGAEPMARIFLTGTAPEGLWVSPRLGVSHRWFNSSGEGELAFGSSDFRRWEVGGAALLGYSTIVGRGLAIQFGAGLEGRYATNTQKMRAVELGTDGVVSEQAIRTHSWFVGERVDLSVGWAF
ncbi:hypothetical protein [Pyxidicoccus sp. MSG2]|uniref:hypothetical protein n=1 Tax=Pyxidicoccus sp. MSG2 TaxID=2996790 RepID=UPI00226E2560|nr:hypothetical protein [Pyxidicoccus sp. MSG2]MCY1017697.1 hypothetical protein [Pyxidicoccus sp. MSG2]